VEVVRGELFPWGWDALHRVQHVLVAGATGAAGRELTRMLLEAGHPPERLHLVAREATAFRWHGGAPMPVEVLSMGAGGVAGLPRVELAFLCTPAGLSRLLAAELVQAGARVVDLSSAFRENPDVPLVVPEINGDTLGPFTQLVAGPNCTAAISSLPLLALDRAFGLEEVVAVSYQAASGAGREGLARLKHELDDPETEGGASPFPAPLAHNVIPAIGAVGSDGWCDEERKLVQELQRLLGRPDLAIEATTVRVPVERCHSVALTLRFAHPAPPERAREVLAAQAGVTVSDDPCGPRPLECAGTDLVHVGRIRAGARGERSLSCFAVGDQLRKGAALNALQVAAALPVA
jgi:aspartate-semialdehyde dehydrogenase